MKKTMPCLKMALAVVPLALTSLNVNAQVILMGDLSGADDSGGNNSLSSMLWKAVGFTTPAGQSYNISDVILHLTGYGSGSTANPTIAIYSDNSGVPGSQIGSAFTDPGAGNGTGSSFTFTPPNNLPTLSPSTSYWLVAHDPNSGTGFGWFYSSAPISPSSDVGATFNGMAKSLNSGGNWSFLTPQGNNFQIDATPVPEPATYTTAAAGLLLSFGAWRKLRAAK